MTARPCGGGIRRIAGVSAKECAKRRTSRAQWSQLQPDMGMRITLKRDAVRKLEILEISEPEGEQRTKPSSKDRSKEADVSVLSLEAARSGTCQFRNPASALLWGRALAATVG